MSVQWFSKNLDAVASIFDNNITLNTTASRYLEEAYKVVVGYSEEEKALIIKAVTKADVDMGLYKSNELYSLIIKPSYGRIHSRYIIKNLTKLFFLDFEKQTSYKYECIWLEEVRVLKILLLKEIKE